MVRFGTASNVTCTSWLKASLEASDSAKGITTSMALRLLMTMNAVDDVLVGSGAWVPGASAVVPPPGATGSPTTPLMLLTTPSIGATRVVSFRFCWPVWRAASALAS